MKKVKCIRGAADLNISIKGDSKERILPDALADILIKHGRAKFIEDVKEVEPEVITPKVESKTRPVKQTRKRPVKK